ncbi:hypothetical protein [Deinococcus fonticola]|uniref:hypothetical protein n=1 Tax=Deinococcus fonticola TaxID=2528713 RepID=UPI001074F84F|nr:hypothetical protein [Deinococcus fonticola]
MTAADISLATITGLLGLFVPVVTTWISNSGKNKETERERLEKRVDELEAGKAKLEERVDAVESELDEVKHDLRNLTDFLQEIISGLYDLPWIQKKAQNLIDRMKK